MSPRNQLNSSLECINDENTFYKDMLKKNLNIQNENIVPSKQQIYTQQSFSNFEKEPPK